MSTPLFIVNPRAGGGKARSFLPLGGEIRFTDGPGHATELARDGLKEGRSLIVAVGGDGTLNEVVNGFFEGNRPLNPSAELGVVGIGTGCDTIKSFRIPKDPRKAFRLLDDFEARSIDLCRVGFRDHHGEEALRYFINIAEAGLGGAVVFSTNKSTKKLGGFLTFFLGTLQAILHHRNATLELQVDGDLPRALVAANIVVGNGKYFGGGMKILPRAEFDDQLLEVLVMGDLSRLELLANLGGVYFGTHLKHPLVECFRASRVKISSTRPLLLDVDGEQPGTTPADFEILPKALKVRIPS